MKEEEDDKEEEDKGWRCWKGKEGGRWEGLIAGPHCSGCPDCHRAFLCPDWVAL